MEGRKEWKVGMEGRKEGMEETPFGIADCSSIQARCSVAFENSKDEDHAFLWGVKDRRKEGRKVDEGREEGRLVKEGRKDGRNEGRKEVS